MPLFHTPRGRKRQSVWKDSLLDTLICCGRGSPNLNVSIFQQLSGRNEEKRKKPQCLNTGPPQHTSGGLVWYSEERASWYILIIKANEMNYFSNLFDKILYMFRTSPLSIIRSISTLYTRNRYLSYQFCWCLLADANITRVTNTYCCVWWWTVGLSETFRVLCQINIRNRASR